MDQTQRMKNLHTIIEKQAVAMCHSCMGKDGNMDDKKGFKRPKTQAS